MSSEDIVIDPGTTQDEPPQTVEMSVVDLLKKDLTELEESTDVFIPVPGYESSGLAVNYRLPTSGKELDAIMQRVFKQTKDNYERGINTALDTMISLCLGLWVQLPDMEERQPLDFDKSGIPVRFDDRLPKNLGWELPPGETTWRARLVVRKLFANNELAIGTHVEKLQRWLQNTKIDIQSEYWESLGELPAVR